MNQPWRLPGKKVADKQAIQANQTETTGQVQQLGVLLEVTPGKHPFIRLRVV
jgi:hypothetical protein